MSVQVHIITLGIYFIFACHTGIVLHKSKILMQEFSGLSHDNLNILQISKRHYHAVARLYKNQP